MTSIITEISLAIKIHASLGSRLGGVHLELTGDIDDEGFSVTECLGGSMELGHDQLPLRFESYCDPRLNFEQSLGAHPYAIVTRALADYGLIADVAFMLSSQYQAARRGKQNDDILEELTGRSSSRARAA